MLVSWKEKESIYSVLVPPLEKEEYEMNAKETKEYFEWYMSKIPERIEYLQEVCSEYLNIPKECIDCSPESLKYVWKWFLDIAKVEKVTEEDRERMRQEMGGPSELVEYMIQDTTEQLSLLTEYILRDIGMYLGEVFVRNHPSIYWGYYRKPKSDIWVNQPLLKGFLAEVDGELWETEFEPIHMAHVQAVNLLDNTQKIDDLYNLYLLWKKDIHEPGCDKDN